MCHRVVRRATTRCVNYSLSLSSYSSCRPFLVAMTAAPPPHHYSNNIFW